MDQNQYNEAKEKMHKFDKLKFKLDELMAIRNELEKISGNTSEIRNVTEIRVRYDPPKNGFLTLEMDLKVLGLTMWELRDWLYPQVQNRIKEVNEAMDKL